MNRTLSVMGLARKAGKLITGHDAVMASVKNGAAETVLLTNDASPRHKKELDFIGFKGKIIFLDADMSETGFAVGKKSCIFSIEDSGFVRAIEKTLTKEGFEDGCKIQNS